MKSEKKIGPGRPPKQPLSGEELRQEALDGMRRCAEARGCIDYQRAEEGLEVLLDDSKLKSATRAELQELRRIAAVLWDKLQCEKQYEDDLAWEGGYGVNREPTPQSEAWDAEHEFLKPKRKNAKKTKNIHTLTDKQKLAKGMSLEPVPMELDIDATEAELEKTIIEREQQIYEREKSFIKGRRLTGRDKVDPAAQQRSNFWR